MRNMEKIKNILFICSGNTCRSPFAEYYTKWLEKTKYNERLKDVKFDSAGIYHYFDKPQEGTVHYLNSKGIDISNFKAKAINEELLKKQDLILGFENKFHINKLKRKFKDLPELNKKLMLLLQFTEDQGNLEIIDPFGLQEEEYNKILYKIEIAVEKSLEKIIKINNQTRKRSV